MSDQIRIYRAEGTWVVRAGDAVLAETRAALELAEGGRKPVMYFPREDIAMALLDLSPTTSTCPFKGAGSYYSIVTNAGTIDDAAWSYEKPLSDVAQIAGYLAFFPDKVTVERV